MAGEITIVRIYLSEADHGKRKTLMQEVLNVLHDQHRVRGVTVFRGIAGFGDAGEVHAADVLRLMVDLPLVIEFFDDPKVVAAVLSLLREMLSEHPIVTWPAGLANGQRHGPAAVPSA
jgi:PII-like signaling protein